MKKRQGFTLIEVLVAIGILMILVGLVTVGFRTLGNSGRANDTKMMLENARSLLAEPGVQDRVKRAFVSVDASSGAIVNGWEEPILPPQGVISADAGNSFREEIIFKGMSTNNKVNYEGMKRVMAEIGGASVNKSAIEKIAPDKLIGKARHPTTNTDENLITPVLLDGWGNPIILVPPGGMRTTVDGQNVIMTSARVVSDPVPSGEPFPPGGARAFFASAGPDGDFSKGDDNVYSFEN